MEVHHHPHVEKKGFKEYFLEFLMIFLAVTMGFIAENIREKISEYKLLKEYAASLVKDLELDSSQLLTYRNYYRYASGNVDTLLQLLANNNPQNIPTGKLYWYGLFGGAHNSFVPNDATMQQIKSTGALRYFSTSIASAIASYDRLCRNIENEQEIDRNIYADVRNSRAQIFEFRYNEMANDIYRGNKKIYSRAKIDSFMESNPPVLSYDKTLFNQYAEMMRSRFLHSYAQNADSLLVKAGELISILKTNYHLQ